MLEPIHKYPRTPHLEGSRLQPGDEDLDAVPLATLRGRHVVIEEKLDGANAGISVGDDGRLRLQSRGHVLTGGARERHFDLFKRWAACHAGALTAALAGGLVLYGEWLYAKHTIFYDRLPHYFLEFDVRDAGGTFWSTARRRAHLAAVPAVRSVPVLWEGIVDDPAALPALVARARYKSPRWRDRLAAAATEAAVEPARAAAETDPSDDAEGLYVKVEADGAVVARYKWVRASFLTSVVDSGSHWLSRPIIPNQLADGVELFDPAGPTP
ncbi:MAG: RNA ligase family protein [Kofleriaceae bacterium]|nr:RNA ligase family protein [Kofleriaceae bacterium]MCB9574830.1 RNA ligase family protein [Kofleriaceae bacterium]